MKIKHYDHVKEMWVSPGAFNARDIQLNNPGYLDDEGNPISSDQGFTKIANKLQKLEDNLAWLYINGALGGGGGTFDEVSIDTGGIDTFYTATGKIEFDIMVKAGSVPRRFTITITDPKTGKIVYQANHQSLNYITIKIEGLSDRSTLDITAVDTNYNTGVKRIEIIYGAVELSWLGSPAKEIDATLLSEDRVEFTIVNRIVGSPSKFVLKINGKEARVEEGIKEDTRSFAYLISDLLGNTEDISPKVGDKFFFEAYASTVLNGVEIKSVTLSFNIDIVDSNKLTIITDGISSTPDSPTNFTKNSHLNFSYYLSYKFPDFRSFIFEYKVFKMGSDGVGVPVEGAQGSIPSSVGVKSSFSLGTLNLPITGEGEYLYIELNAYAEDDPSAEVAKDSKTVYAFLSDASEIPLYANNRYSTLLAYYSNVTGFPTESITKWEYFINPTTDTSLNPFPYIETGIRDTFKNTGYKVNLSLHKTNGSTTGFIQTQNAGHLVPGLVLNGESYARLETANQMFPYTIVGSGLGFFRSTGFSLSTTFRTENIAGVSGTVMSIGSYKEDKFYSGIEINTDKVIVRIGGVDSIDAKIPIGDLVTVDIDVSKLGSYTWFFKIFINGVLSAVSRVLHDGKANNNIDWYFNQDVYYGCRNNAGVLSNFSNVTIYDIKVYTSSQSELAIVQNYISATEQASLINNGQVDKDLDYSLRSKNLFDSNGECFIWDYAQNKYFEGTVLYEKLLGQVGTESEKGNTPYPLVMIEEKSDTRTNFKAYVTATGFSASDKLEIMKAQFPCEIYYTDTKGSAKISSNVTDSKGVRVGIQGTSSLSYNSKNLELYLGDLDNLGEKKLLFLPREDWLPENRFTLKADVMDSAHVNNVAIGKIINGEALGKDGKPVEVLKNTPPMEVSNSLFVKEDGSFEKEHAEKMQKKIKHTSDGFPCLVFVNFAPEGSVTTDREVRFMGIYNFNLGRHAHYNLGLKLLTDYTLKEDIPGVVKKAPAVVQSYAENVRNWNGKGSNNERTYEGTHSMEINQNNSSKGAFQQDHETIVKFMADYVYSSVNEAEAFVALQKFYGFTAHATLERTEKFRMDDALISPNVSLNEWYEESVVNESYNFDLANRHLNWDNAVAYFVVMIVFGMVDSVVKNLTLRNWGEDVWYPSFYDMDTAFGLTNAGQDTVDYWAHLHRWINVLTGAGTTGSAIIENYPHTESGVKQHFASYWSRLWEILENLPNKDPNGLEGHTIASMYVSLRQRLFWDPEKFIENHYKNYTDQTGAIMFNYDYNIKYLSIKKTYKDGVYTDTTDFSQLKFLHGNRVIHVKDWFKKRILFLDSIYGVSGERATIPIEVDSPVNKEWLDNKAAGVVDTPSFGVIMKTPSKMRFRWSIDGSSAGSFWVDNEDTPGLVLYPGGETVISLFAHKYITKFENFKNYNWTLLTSMDFPLLKELDLSYLKIDKKSFFDTLYDIENDKGLRSLEKLDLSHANITSSSSDDEPYTLKAENCRFLKHLDISNSSITNVNLPIEAVLKYYNLSNTAITTLTLTNQAFLETLVLDGCDNLKQVNIINCNSLSNINLPKNVEVVNIERCALLEGLSLTYQSSNNSISNLASISIATCPNLKRFDITGQNNERLSVSLLGAANLEELILTGTRTDKILLPPLKIDGVVNFGSLRLVDISNTNITNFIYNDMAEAVDYLDLRSFPKLESIKASNNKELKVVKCVNNPLNPIELPSQAFYECSNLQRIYGTFDITGIETFKNCASFILNDSIVYETYFPENHIGLETGTNVIITSSSLKGSFMGCGSLTYNDFKRITYQFHSGIVSMEAAFRDCIKIIGPLRRDFFTKSRNVRIAKEMFAGSGINGDIRSRHNSFTFQDESTWGFFDYALNLTDAEGAFESSMIEWIDNNLFQPVGEKFYTINNVEHLFRNCSNLKSAQDTWADIIIPGRLNSETFFLYLKSTGIKKAYIKEMFIGCQFVDMDIISDELGNTFLFHTLDSTVAHDKLLNELHTGINLIGEIKVNVFGGISNQAGPYFIPKFTSIQFPFRNTGPNVVIELSKMGRIFRNIGGTLKQAIGIFSGMGIIGTDKSIPNDIFQGCVELNSVESIFSNIPIDNNGVEYEFPNATIFKDTVKLSSIKNILAGTNKIKIKLLGEGFKNCILEDVSGAFSSSGIYGYIPYRLFFMENKTAPVKVIRRTIKRMDGVFSGCWYLGYDKLREIDTETVYIAGSQDVRKLTWGDRIVSKKGGRVYFRLPVFAMEKSHNFEWDPNPTIPNPLYNAVTSPEEPLTIPNPKYSPELLTFDNWYLDGFGWDGAKALDSSLDAELAAEKLKLDKYFIYDRFQKQAILDQNFSERYVNSNQNYMIPTDLFRYCHAEATLVGVLDGLSWKENILKGNNEDNIMKVVATEEVEGLQGRIPVRLLESLIDNTKFDALFKNTRFDAFYGLYKDPSTQVWFRGIAYPPELFKHNIALEEIPELFSLTTIPVGVDVSPGLFKYNTNLRNISSVWSNVRFDERAYNAQSWDPDTVVWYSQIPFLEIFDSNPKINNATGLFAVTMQDDTRGLRIINSDLLSKAYNLNSVSQMFSRNILMKGSVPLFKSVIYTALNGVEGYLRGVNKNNITNSAELEFRLQPAEWNPQG